MAYKTTIVSNDATVDTQEKKTFSDAMEHVKAEIIARTGDTGGKWNVKIILSDKGLEGLGLIYGRIQSV